MITSGFDTPTDTKLELARVQKIHNLKLKRTCLENEEYIQELLVSDWSRQQQVKLFEAHEKAHELLAAVETGTKWKPTESLSPQRLIKLLGLVLQVKDLSKPEDRPRLEDLRALRARLLELKQHPNKARIVSFTGTIDNAIARVERLEDELRRTQIDATELAEIPVQVISSTEDIFNVQPSAPNLQAHEEEINKLLAKIEKVKEIRNVAIADGEMIVAEDQFYLKAQLLEQLVELIRDKFRVLAITEDDNRTFQHFSEGPKKSFQATQPLKDKERLLKKKCEGDLKLLHEAIQRADLEDATALKDHTNSVERSDKIIKENEEAQNACWKKIQELERQLQKLSAERVEEVKRRVEDNEVEEKRKVEYHQFLDAAAQHRKLLELTIHNCDAMLRGITLVEDLVSEIGAALKARYSKCTIDLGDQKLRIHQQYLDAFARLYKTLGQLIYKKERRLEEIDRQIRNAHIQLEFSIETFDPNAKKHSDEKKQLYNERAKVEEGLQQLKEKLKMHEEQFAPTAAALRYAGIEFTHPADLVEDGNLQRRSKMVEYKVHLHNAETSKLTAERENIRRSKQLLVKGSPLSGTGSHVDPYSPGPIQRINSPTETPTRIAAAPSSPPGSTNNPRKALLGEMNATFGGNSPIGKYKANLGDQVITYEFTGPRTLVIEFKDAPMPAQHATFDLNTRSEPNTLDVHLAGVLISPQHQK
eukprot:TRINITY_DN66677_c2_g5_i1.p1 TRINITY_DN66677_c2_g5~~TRINITY_DN66677_c2_g5_i1.p1  ORF type:complete len:703 (-),score=99.71 TRINITY_DN66677_c2_g5_i1:2-2110(-)